MTSNTTNASADATHKISSYRGQVVYIFAYDIAYDMNDQPIAQLLGKSVSQFAAGPSKRSPRELFFYCPQMIRLDPIRKEGPRGPVMVERTVKIFPVGAISIAVSVPFEVSSSEELVAYHELAFADGSLHDQVKQLADEVRRELAPYCIRPYGQLKEEEAYTVFCIHSPLLDQHGTAFSTEKWFASHPRQIAAILTQEDDPEQLSEQEAAESTGRYLSYYQYDLTVIDWDAAIVIDKPENLEEILHVMELANVQFAELEAYDRSLDEFTTGSYRDLGKRQLRGRSDVLANLREIRVDLSRLSDELFNTTKFFGDWHLARIYQTLSARFHLADWQKVVDEKLKTLDSLYQILKQDQMNWWMMTLEITIVLLFIIDLIVLLVPLIR